MGNSLSFWKSDGRANEEPSDKPSSVEEAASVIPPAAGPITLKHTLRPLDQGQLHSPTATTSRPVNVSSVAEPKEISDQDERKTSEATEQSQVLHVEADVSALLIEGQPQTTSVAVGEDGSSGTCKSGHSTRTGSSGTGRTGHSTRTGEDGSSVTSKRGHSTRTGSSGTSKTGHSTRTKRKHKTTTRKRQHGELTSVCVEHLQAKTETYGVVHPSFTPEWEGNRRKDTLCAHALP